MPSLKSTYTKQLFHSGQEYELFNVLNQNYSDYKLHYARCCKWVKHFSLILLVKRNVVMFEWYVKVLIEQAWKDFTSSNRWGTTIYILQNSERWNWSMFFQSLKHLQAWIVAVLKRSFVDPSIGVEWETSWSPLFHHH